MMAFGSVRGFRARDLVGLRDSPAASSSGLRVTGSGIHVKLDLIRGVYCY